MSDEVVIEGKEYVSSKRASELSGYAQDYIGQLARGGYIDAKRVGGLWHVSMDSLKEYEKNAIDTKSRSPGRGQNTELDSLIAFDGKDYISAARAAQLTGYHQDYVGQLARNQTIISRQVGNRWYVDREAILLHKTEKDRLLGAVQAEAVGIRHTEGQQVSLPSNAFKVGSNDYLTYTKDTADLIPLKGAQDAFPYASNKTEDREDRIEREDEIESKIHAQVIPIRVSRVSDAETIIIKPPTRHLYSHQNKNWRKTLIYSIIAALLSLAALSVVYIGIRILGPTFSSPQNHSTLMTPVMQGATALGDFVEEVLLPELHFDRAQTF